MNNKGQLTIFILIAIIIVATVAGFFILKGTLTQEKIPQNMIPIQTSFLSCLEDNLLTGIDVLGSQGGYITLPEFKAGSKYMPFSSQLDFLGNPIPYWYYVSGNNLPKEQIPTKSTMQQQLVEFVEEKISNCKFNTYYEEGFEITTSEPKAQVKIRDKEVEINLDMDLAINKGEESVLIKDHKIITKSNLGTLFEIAKDIYEKEQKTLFLENYGVDILRLYAPVDGVELSCSPKLWSADEVFDTLEEAIESNTLAIKTKSGDYTLTQEHNKYFITDISTEAEVRFINSQKWSNAFEVSPSEENVLIAKPVGNQPGLGSLGFCYIPYHFVYNVRYPVLIQVSKGEEIFQFPVAVVIQGNNPRKALDVEAIGTELPELCNYKNTLTEIITYDTELNQISAEISYECFGKKCEIGKTLKTDSLKEEFPQCINGFITAKAEGFADTKYMHSTTEPDSVTIIMNKLYEKEIQLNLGDKKYTQQAMIVFISEDSSETVIFPNQNTIELSEGQYEIQVYIYRNSTLELAATTKQQCVEVPESGIGGFFGFTKEKCFDVNIPAQIVSTALSGGGKEKYYIVESELKDSEKIEINVPSLPTPTSIEQLQENYILFEENNLEIYFK